MAVKMDLNQSETIIIKIYNKMKEDRWLYYFHSKILPNVEELNFYRLRANVLNQNNSILKQQFQLYHSSTMN